MITALVQINLLPANFSTEKTADQFFKITLPETPRIGDQIMTKKTLQVIEKSMHSWAWSDQEDELDIEDSGGRFVYSYNFSSTDLTYVTNIAYGDDNVLFIGLSYNPSKSMCLAEEIGPSYQFGTYYIFDKTPKIGEQIAFDSLNRKFVHEVVYDSYRQIFTITFGKNPPVQLVNANIVNNKLDVNIPDIINANINNTVSTRIVNNKLDVYVENDGLEVFTKNGLDVYVKNDSIVVVNWN